MAEQQEGVKTELSLQEGSNVFYRIEERGTLPSYPQVELLRATINFSSQEPVNLVLIEIEGKKKYLVYSRPAWYSRENQDYHLVDACVLGETEEEALDGMSRIVRESGERKGRFRGVVRDQILPRLAEMPHV